MPRGDLVLLTDDRYEKPALVNDYVANLLLEDRLLQDALTLKGYATVRVAWSHPTYDWAQARAVVLRTPWDYFEKYAAFSAWLHRVSIQTPVVNPPDLLRWNMDKVYFKDLERAGVALPPTVFYPRGSTLNLAVELQRRDWAEAVLKPTVSGAARHTYRVNRTTLPALQNQCDAWLQEESFMLQPFIPSVLTRGEVSLMFFGGRYSHAVRKVAKPGDFRVQDDHGGVVLPHYQPRTEELKLAQHALRSCPQPPVYARVDLVDDLQGRPLLMELEVVEPELFLRHAPAAATAFAEALASVLI